MSGIDVTLYQVGYGDEEPLVDRVDRVCAAIQNISRPDLLLLPELWAHGGFASASWARTAESIHGHTIGRLAELAPRLDCWIHAGSIIELADEGAHRGAEGRGLWNTSVLLSPLGEIHSTYRKIHRFGFGVGEPQILEAGSQLTVTDLACPEGSARVGLATCYDLRFPELFRKLGERGAEVVLIPAAWPKPRMEHWRLLGRARAVENQAWVLQCNSSGTHCGVELGGSSQVVAPTGEVVAQADSDEEILTARLDLDLARQVREDFPVLRDSRM